MRSLCILLMLLSQLPTVVKTSAIFQDRGVIRAEVGQNVTLRCSCQNDGVTFFSWYQQSLGGKPNIISTLMKHNTQADISPAYEERFQVFAQSQDSSNHLIIRDVRLSDSATYYCGTLEFSAIEFGQGVFLHVKTSLSNIQAVIHQPALEPHQSGDSVNLSCTVHTEVNCAGEQRLFWFKHGASQPAIMNPSEGQCTSLTNEKPHTKTCSLTLRLKSVRSPDTGMYYCALASCGEIVFGNGAALEIVDGSTKLLPLLVYCLIVALAVSIIVLFALAFVMYRLKKKLCSVCKGSVSHLQCAAAPDALSQDTDTLHYAALSLNRNSEQHHHMDNMDSVCVYSRVKSRKE